jgi:tocopherol O-methyltransferase
MTPITEQVREHYDRLAPLYRRFWGDHLHHGYWENGESLREAQVKLVAKLSAKARIPRGARVLDLGCGFGASSLWLASHFGCSVTGITVSPVQQAIAIREARRQGLAHRAHFKVMDINSLCLPEASFDVIWIIECSEHLAEKDKLIRRCSQLLKPGGRLALCAWLAVDTPNIPRRDSLLDEICEAAVCSSLATLKNYVGWLRENDFKRIQAADISRNVAKTWAYANDALSQPVIRAFLRVATPGIRRFAESFDLIRRAYSEGAMAYGMITAVKT